MGKKKICFIAQFPPPLHGLSKAVDILFNSELKTEFEFEKIDITNNKKFLLNLIAISKSKADLFYFTISQSKGGNIRDLLIMRLLNIRKKACLVHLHGGYYRTLVNRMRGLQRNANYKAVSQLAGAIVLGPSLKWIFQGMLPDERIFTVFNCVGDEYLMSDAEFDEKVKTVANRNMKHVLYLSNFLREKGYAEVLEMARLEKEKVTNGGTKRLHFDFAGAFFENSEKVFFDGFVADNGLEEYITYHGVVDGKKKYELLRQCDFFVLLTTYPAEGQPISILEAMGNGMYILTTPHGGIPDIVGKESGLILDEARVNSCVVERIRELPDHELTKVMITNRERIKRKHLQTTYVNNIKDIFMAI